MIFFCLTHLFISVFIYISRFLMFLKAARERSVMPEFVMKIFITNRAAKRQLAPMRRNLFIGNSEEGRNMRLCNKNRLFYCIPVKLRNSKQRLRVLRVLQYYELYCCCFTLNFALFCFILCSM